MTGGVPQALLGAADIARLAGVRRPAVSNWRRRHADFPRPVAGSSTNPLFALEEVEQWCRRNGKPFQADTAERLWQRIQAAVAGVRVADFLAHTGLLLTGHGGPPVKLPEPDGDWDVLLGAVEEAAGACKGGAEGLYTRLYERFAATRERSAQSDGRIAAAMARIAGVGAGAAVLDPACGGGGLLAAAAEQGASLLWGQDLDPARAVIARSRLLLAGKECETFAGDTLRHDGFAGREADAVLCDPPFRDRHWGHDELAGDPRWVYGHPARGEGELAWVQHCLSRVRPGGTVVVQMPAAAADRPSGRRVRAALLAAGAVRMVAELPGGDGAPHLWVLRRPAAGGVPPRNLYFVRGAGSPEEIVGAWAASAGGGGGAAGAAGAETPAAEAVEVAITDLLDSAAALRPPAPRPPGGHDGAAYAALRGELRAALAAVAELPPQLAPAAEDGAAEQGRTEATVAELAAAGLLEIHQAPLGAPTGHGPLPLLTHKDLRERRPPSGRSRKAPGQVAIRPGDVVTAAGGGSPHPRVADDGEAGAVLGPRLLLFRPDQDRLDPGYLAGVLEGAAADAGNAGASAALRFDPRKVTVPMVSWDQQRARAEARRRLDAAEERLAAAADLGRRLAELGRLGLAAETLLPPTTEEAPR